MPRRINGQTWHQWARELFEFENCAECGRGAKGHTPAVTPFGAWFARCKIAVYGEYGRDGYEIWSAVGKNVEQVYSAGNCSQDSQAVVDPSDSSADSLRRVRSYCIKSAREFAEELGAEFISVERREEQAF